MAYATAVFPKIAVSAAGGANANTVVVESETILSGQRIIANTASGVVYASRDLLETVQTVLGFTKNAGTVLEVIVQGVYSDPTMAWDPLLPLWLGINGELTQVKPTAGYLLEVGKVITPTEIVINIQSPIILA